ncbi:hypothetical protein GCM10010468_46720 [Actinocorallia longicatena]|uniref:HD domain-containing protein n=1 Tax=Actinocorallia longicatena TaxID=111803 RepID=A0ABP6QDT9_9ACTN
MNAALFETLLSRLPEDIPATDRDLIRRAFACADRWHKGQRRKRGDPYLTHPVTVAASVIDPRLDRSLVCAALLHDVIDDIGRDATLVERLTELDRMIGPDVEGGADDRAFTLKLLDRLHNMRTLQHHGPRAGNA